MVSDASPIAEQGVATLPDEAWTQALHRTEIIGPLAALEVVGHEAADAAAQALGLSRRQETARSLFALASMGRRDSETLDRLRASFVKEDIPPEFLSHYLPDGPFACLIRIA